MSLHGCLGSTERGGCTERGGWRGVDRKVGKGLAKGWRRVGKGLAKGWQRVGTGFPCTLQLCNFQGARLEDWVCDSMGLGFKNQE